MITILGSTGTIGKNTLSVLKNTDKQNKVFALSANKNINLLKFQFLTQQGCPDQMKLMVLTIILFLMKNLKN